MGAGLPASCIESVAQSPKRLNTISARRANRYSKTAAVMISDPIRVVGPVSSARFDFLKFQMVRSQGLIAAVLIFVVAFFLTNAMSASSFSYSDLSYMSTGGATLALAAIGAAVVIISGGFDLSVGAVISLVNVVLTASMKEGAGSEILVGLAGVLVGGAVGTFNGFLIAYVRMQPIVVTLASMFIVEGITLLIRDTPGGQLPGEFSSFLTGDAIPNLFPASAAIIVLALVLWRLLKNSRFGTALYAIGSDERAALYAGINVRRTRFLAYLIAGIAYGAAGVMVSAQTGFGDPLIGNPLLLSVFAAVVIGGTALGGGRGGCAGPAIGAYTIMLIVNLLLVLNVSAYYSTVVTGVLLILAALGGTIGRETLNWPLLFRRSARSGRADSIARTARPTYTAQAMEAKQPWMIRHQRSRPIRRPQLPVLRRRGDCNNLHVWPVRCELRQFASSAGNLSDDPRFGPRRRRSSGWAGSLDTLDDNSLWHRLYESSKRQ